MNNFHFNRFFFFLEKFIEISFNEFLFFLIKIIKIRKKNLFPIFFY